MACRLAVIVVCLASAAVRAAAQPAPPGTTTRSPTTTAVTRIEIAGNRRVEADAIRRAIATRPGQSIDPDRLRADVRAIWALGVVEDVTVATRDGGVVAFAIRERPAIRKVVIAGNHAIALRDLDDALDLRRGAPVDALAVRRNRDQLAALYARRGFALAEVAATIEPAGDGEVDVRFAIQERAQLRIRDVTLVGNRALRDAELREVLATRPPGALSAIIGGGVYQRDALDHDLAALTAHYLDRGFATVTIGAPRLRLSRDHRFLHVTIPIDEGPRFAFGAVELAGDVIAGLPALAARAGATFSRAAVVQDREALERAYQDRGYARASVVPRTRIDRATRRVAVRYEIARGRRVFVERIRIRGNARTRDRVIRRELQLAEGELFSGARLEASRRRVLALGYFERVTVATAPGSADDQIVIDVEVAERDTGRAQLGGGASSVEAYLIQGQLGYQNFLGRGQTIAIEGQISRLRRLLSLRFVEPRLLDTDWLLGVEAYHHSRGLGALSRDATGAALTFGHALTEHLHAAVTYRLEQVGISRGPGGITSVGARATSTTLDPANLLRGGLTSSVRAALTWDARDDRLRPGAGTFVSGYLEYAGRLTGSERELVRWGGSVRRYRPLGGGLVLRLAGELGMTMALDGEGVPLTERYLLGGPYDVRGYALRSLGPVLLAPRADDPVASLAPLPLGGNLELVGNAELEFPLVPRLGLRGVAFFDVGNAYNLEPRFCGGTAVDACLSPAGMLRGLRTSVGIGVRWQSPIGPLRLEWGIPLSLRPGEQATGPQLTFGAAF